MKSEIQVDGMACSLSAVSKALVHGYPRLNEYEEAVGIRGMNIAERRGRMIVYPFGDAGRRYVLCLSGIHFRTGESAAVTAASYDPETSDEMLEEFMSTTDAEETDTVPNGFFEVYNRIITGLLKRKIERTEGRA